MPYAYDYTLANGTTFVDAQITIPSRDRTGEITPTDLLRLWRDEPDSPVMVSSKTEGLTVVAFGDITSLTISMKA